MENHQNKLSLEKVENVTNQKDVTHKSNVRSVNFSELMEIPLEKNLSNRMSSIEILKNFIKESENTNNISTIKTAKTSNNKNKLLRNSEKNLSAEQEQSVGESLQSADASELSFLTNDFLSGDCNCIEQASQLVDPTLIDSESTPISFNNNDTVQLYKFNLTNSHEDNLMSLNKNCNDLMVSRKNITEKYGELLGKSDKVVEKNHNNSHQVLELFNGNTNANVLETNNQNFKSTNTTCQNNGILNEKKEKKEFGGPIKRGRRYLPDFKQEVLKYAKNHTFKETASHFNVNSNTITEWSREWERLPPKEKCAKTSPLSCSNNKNHKTDILGTPISKTEVILLNDICLETDYNESSSLTHIKKDLPSSAGMKPDERFLKWIEQKRLEKKELTRQEVVFVAKCCLKKIPENRETSWFVSWFKRYNKVLNSINSNEETEKYIKYPNSFKLEVVLYARLFTKNSAARVFNVPRKRMFDWFNHFNTLKESFGLIEKNESGEEKEEKRKIVFSTKKNDETKNKIYSELHLWYQKTLLNGTRPTSNDVSALNVSVIS